APRPTALTFFTMSRRPPRSPLFPYTTLFRSSRRRRRGFRRRCPASAGHRGCFEADQTSFMQPTCRAGNHHNGWAGILRCGTRSRSEEHTSELQSRENLVCRLLLEKKKHKELL